MEADASAISIAGTDRSIPIPGADTLPRVTVDFRPVPSTTNPTGRQRCRRKRHRLARNPRSPESLMPLANNSVGGAVSRNYRRVGELGQAGDASGLSFSKT